MKKISNILCFDTEFIFGKDKQIPIEVAFTSYKVAEKNKNLGDFDVFFIPKSKKDMTKRFVEYTHIDYKFLKEHGVDSKKGSDNIKRFLVKFKLNETLFVGWDIHNDLIVFNKVFKSFRLHKKKLKFLDLAKVYKDYNKLEKTPGLNSVCEKYGLYSDIWHKAKEDAEMTAKLLDKLIEEYGYENVINHNEIHIK